MTELVGVRYIGQKPVKRDTVCKTLTTWTPGSVSHVERHIAENLFRFPAIWQPEDASFEPPKRPKLAEPEPKIYVPPEPEPEADSEGEQDAPRAMPDETPIATSEDVLGIIPSLDKDRDFTPMGKPKIDAVRARMPNFHVTLEAVRAAWTQFQGD